MHYAIVLVTAMLNQISLQTCAHHSSCEGSPMKWCVTDIVYHVNIGPILHDKRNIYKYVVTTQHLTVNKLTKICHNHL